MILSPWMVIALLIAPQDINHVKSWTSGRVDTLLTTRDLDSYLSWCAETVKVPTGLVQLLPDSNLTLRDSNGIVLHYWLRTIPDSVLSLREPYPTLEGLLRWLRKK